MTSARRLQHLRAVLDRRQPDLTVLMENVHKSHNLSAIVRSCDAVGVLEVHAVSRRERVRLFHKIAGGTRRYLEVRRHRSLSAAFAHLEERGFTILAAHPATGAVDFREVDYTRPTAILLGQEKDGVSAPAASLAHRWVAIPMLGMGTSLNVSVAAALILFEAQRQRRAAGLYARSRLDPERYRQKLFEWIYPRVAEVCRRRSLPYPALDEEGRLVGPVSH